MVLDYYYLVHKIARNMNHFCSASRHWMRKTARNLNHHSSTSRRQMRLTGLEPVRVASHAPQKCAYANSATAA